LGLFQSCEIGKEKTATYLSLFNFYLKYLLCNQKYKVRLGLVVPACNPNRWEDQAGGLRIEVSWAHKDTLPQRKKYKKLFLPSEFPSPG
jgi:hypothetical protein